VAIGVAQRRAPGGPGGGLTEGSDVRPSKHFAVGGRHLAASRLAERASQIPNLAGPSVSRCRKSLIFDQHRQDFRCSPAELTSRTPSNLREDADLGKLP
jgi:hypothetical protein